MLHTGYSPPEVRPHSWLSHRGTPTEESSAVSQELALTVVCTQPVDAVCLLIDNSVNVIMPTGLCISTSCLLQSMPGESAPSEPRKDLFPVQAQSKGDASALQAYIPPVAAAMQAANSASSAVGPAPQPVSLSSKKHEVSAYTTGLLAHGSGEEISFEEVRAATWFAQQAHMQKVRAMTACQTSCRHQRTQKLSCKSIICSYTTCFVQCHTTSKKIC